MPAHVGQNKVRVLFTCTKQQNDFLDTMAKNLKISKGAVIRRLLKQNIGVIMAKANMTPEEEELLQTTIAIAKTKWLDDDDD